MSASTLPTTLVVPTSAPGALSEADVSRIAAEVVRRITTGSLATPEPVVAATVPDPEPVTREMVTYTNGKGQTRTCTMAQFAQRERMAQGTLTVVSVEDVKVQTRTIRTQAGDTRTVTYPEPAKTHKAPKADKGSKALAKQARKAANKALATALRASGLNPADPIVWKAAQAQAGIA